MAPAYRIAIYVSRLRVTSAGVALLDANWEVLARDRMKRPILGRARIKGVEAVVSAYAPPQDDPEAQVDDLLRRPHDWGCR